MLWTWIIFINLFTKLNMYGAWPISFLNFENLGYHSVVKDTPLWSTLWLNFHWFLIQPNVHPMVFPLYLTDIYNTVSLYNMPGENFFSCTDWLSTSISQHSPTARSPKVHLPSSDWNYDGFSLRWASSILSLMFIVKFASEETISVCNVVSD